MKIVAIALVAVLSGCTITVRRGERDLSPLRPSPEARPALRLEVVEAELLFMNLCASGGRFPAGVGTPETAPRAVVERQLHAWRASGLFESAVSAELALVPPTGLAVRARIFRDMEESDAGNGLALLTMGAWPLVFGKHQDQLLSLDAAFHRDGRFLGEITRVERLSSHSHVLLLPIAWLDREERALESAERDLVHAVLLEAQARGYL